MMQLSGTNADAPSPSLLDVTGNLKYNRRFGSPVRGTLVVVAAVMLGAHALDVVPDHLEGRADLPTLRPPITINGDDEFTPENGVTGGSGTNEDPFIIAGWLISGLLSHGILIENTRNHVLVANSHILLTYSYAGGPAIRLANATNVIVQSNVIVASGQGIAVDRGSIATLLDNNITGSQHSANPVSVSHHGIAVANGSSAVIERNSVRSFYRCVSINPESEAIVVHNQIRGCTVGALIQNGKRVVVLRENHIQDTFTGLLVVNAENVTVDRNHLEFVGHAIDSFANPEETNKRIVVSNNTIADTPWVSLVLDCLECVVEHNLFEAMGEGITLGGPVQFVLNIMRDNEVAIGWETWDTAIIRDNIFEHGNSIYAIATGVELDLRENWWDSPHGPLPKKLVSVAGGSFLVHPWLSEPPAGAGPT